jgi:hypothetical protein
MSRPLLVLGGSSSVVCLVTAVSYGATPLIPVPGNFAPRLFIAVVGTLGATSLLVASLWQHFAPVSGRRLALLTLAGLAAGYLVANTIGLTMTGGIFVSPPRALHSIGLAAGAALFALACVELLTSEAAQRVELS